MGFWIEHYQGRPKLLVVDDKPINIRIINELFRADCDLHMATHGAQAIAVSKTLQPDLILLDIMMDGMDGLEVCRRLKMDPATAAIPVIFITAKREEDDEALGLELGAVDYISKPLNSAIVRARVKTHLTLKLQNDYLKGLARVDGLTGIPNRRAFDVRLAQAWSQACREGRTLSLMMIDIDYFKRYNDHFGHVQGDECLRQVAKAIAQSVNRPYDMAARFGGEEFACILPETNLQGALILADKIQARISQLAVAHPGSEVSKWVSLSIGVASLQPRIDREPSELIALADQQLYQAKQNGRNQIFSLAA
ncbi:PleD family two-component system response regulator [Pseudomonas sp. MIL19]|uniref:PleD family two-component system response regulator n=1 Tax=Pseudomonas sp. MIL19 TaxID=2976979 RepID=UPI002363BE20|nr:PleD family two-component system response regulator [Pseudomonas sp. MIL19]MDD2159394.1 PleD family two-component system response regulator [Pseudomonas sp. MIL19]